MMDQDEFQHTVRQSREYFESSANLSRRALARIAAGGAAAIAMLGNMRAASALTNSLEDGNGIRLLVQAGTQPSDDDLKFFREVGYKYVYTQGGFDRTRTPTVDEMLACKKRYADGGIILHNMRYLLGGMGGNDINLMQLDLPGADAACERVINFIRNTGKNGAGFDYTGGRLEVTGVWESGPEVDIRGGAMERNFDPASSTVHASDYAGDMDRAAPKPAGGINTLYWGREYKYDEVMANYKKWIVGKLGPVAEENNVFLGFHPDDPPVFESMGGVSRVMSNYERIKAVLTAGGPAIGLQMCCGIWLEGGDKMGKDLLPALKEFWEMKKYREVALRNVSSPPVNGVVNFHETFQDNGYYDMYKIMKQLVDINYQGFVNMEHHPDNQSVPGSPYAYMAYGAAYMKSSLQAAQYNAGKPVTR